MIYRLLKANCGNNTNMRHVFAYISSGKLVHSLSEIHSGVSLRCATCDNAVVLRKSRGIPGRRYIRPHFALKTAGNSGSGGICSGGGSGESREHFVAKDILLHRLHDLRINIPLCKDCDAARTLSLQPIEFSARLERGVGGLGRLRFDVVVTQNGEDVGVLEVCHTHATDRAKVEAVIARGLWYAEYRAVDIIQFDEQTTNDEPMQLQSLAPRGWITDITCSECVMRHERQKQEAENRRREENERLAKIKHAREMSDVDVANAAQKILALWKTRLVLRMEEYKRARAIGRESIERSPELPKTNYERGYVKCTNGCGWFPKKHVFGIDRDDKAMTNAEFNDYESYIPKKYQNDAINLCGKCAIQCAMCLQPFPRDHAKKYGLCFGCNKKCKLIREIHSDFDNRQLDTLMLRDLFFPEDERIIVERYRVAVQASNIDGKLDPEPELKAMQCVKHAVLCEEGNEEREEIEKKNRIAQEREDIFRRILAEAMQRQARVIYLRLQKQRNIINSPPTCLCETKCPPEGLSERGACKRYCMGTRYLQWLQRRGRPHVKVRAMLSKNSQALLDIHMPVDLGTCERTPTCKTCKRPW